MSANTTSRDALITRLRKLSQMTIANGCSETEAGFAAQRISTLMAEWNVGQDELTIKADAQGCIRDSVIEIIHGQPYVAGMLAAVNQLFTVRCWKDKDKTDDLLGIGLPITYCEIVIFGYPADVAAAKALCEIIASAVQTETTRFLEAQGRRSAAKRKSTLEMSFRTGMAARISERLKEMATPIRVSNGRDLMVLKQDLVNNEFRKLGIHLSSSGLSATDSGAYHAGRSAGANVDLAGSRKLGGTLALPGRA